MRLEKAVTATATTRLPDSATASCAALPKMMVSARSAYILHDTTAAGRVRSGSRAQGDDGARVHGESPIRHCASGQATGFGRFAIGRGKFRVDSQFVVHGAQRMKVLIYQVPGGFRIGLKLVANDAGPLGAVQQQ